ncbi:MAG: type I DNA topoisomerase [Desulfarculales bacterium]|nr:type I DNA topoisomerase [Desulfarculales bacterium]
MSKALLIVESPAKAKTINKYLGSDFEVKASLGHVMDLPPNRLGVDLEHDFSPEYQVIEGKEKIVRELQRAARQAEAIYLAPDPDREGEAIAWHIARQLGGDPEKYHRVLFHELTKPAILKAVQHPQHLNENSFNSQQARRVLDRLVGYQISPLLWDKVKRGLSAGRVQSVALRLVVERERAVKSFISEEYWTLESELQACNPPLFKARLQRLNDKKFDPHSQDETEQAMASLQGQAFTVNKIIRRERKTAPAAPFITSTLQQEAFRKLGFEPKRTMSLAQKLYEGQETEEGQMGLITYMRTDSTRLAEEAVKDVRAFIAKRFGPEYVPSRPQVYKAKAMAQEAHEAIRPTSVLRTPESLLKYLKKDELALYRLIWNRFVSCQMAMAVYDQTQVDIQSGPGLWRASGQVMRFPGFTAVYVEGYDEGQKGKSQNDEEPLNLPPLEEGQTLVNLKFLPKQHFTQPPPRFTEASLVKELEDKGIGRPSTYASILSTLQDKEYAAKYNRRYLVPTSLGEIVNDLLVENFPQVMEVNFTARLEDSLDQVEEGKEDWKKLLRVFYQPFSAALNKAKIQMRQVKGKGLPAGIDCPHCARPLNIRLGKHGEFLACSAWPECNYTSDFERDDKGAVIPVAGPELPEEKCDKCGAPMIVKKGRFGLFLACSAYPKCRNNIPLDANGQPMEASSWEELKDKCPKCGSALLLRTSRAGNKFIACSAYPKCRYATSPPLDVACPECGGQLTEKRSRRGKAFYGCNNYPECKFASWDKPVDHICPACGGKIMLEKVTRQGKSSLLCPNSECKYSMVKE